MSRTTLRAAMLIAAVALPAAALAQDSLYEARLHETLRARDPRAESLFTLAGEAFAAQNHYLAADHLARVLQRVPDFAPATRRLAYVHRRLGNHRVAIELLDSLLVRDSSAFTRSALAAALVDRPAGVEPLPAQVARARALAAAAATEAPDEPSVWMSAFEVAVTGATPDTALLRRTALALVRLGPGEWRSWLPMIEYGLAVGRFDLATMAHERARSLGMPPEIDEQVSAYERSRHEAHDRTLALVGGVILLTAWVLAFGALFGLGALLSRAALRAAGRALAHPTGEARGLDARLRQAYQVVLWGSGAFFYASMPLLLVVVLATGGGLVYLLLSLGHVPVKLLLIVVILTGVTALAILRGLFARYEEQDPGTRTDPAAHPGLRRVLDDVAAKVGTRPVDTVFLTPGTEIAVFERGDMRRQLQGRAERCLILGIGVLDGLSMRQFRSILAHEYGHFSNRDTAGGGLALSVRRSLVDIATGIARGGAAAWFNPAWLFLRAFHAVFMRISQGASRLQEVLADRWAASCYGSPAFEQGLTHVIRSSVRFDHHANRTVREVLEQKRPLPNLYRYAPAPDAEEDAAAEREAEAALEAEPSPYDSHPAPRQRLAWVRGYGSEGGPPEPDDEAPAWTLLEDRQALEEAMTGEVRRNVETEFEVRFAPA